MKKYFFCVLFSILSLSLFAQHKRNDLAKYDEWYKLRFELAADNNIRYVISHCFSSGEEYEISESEHHLLPLYMKIFCLALVDEFMPPMLNSMTYEENGALIKITGFSFIIAFNQTEEELLEALGEDMVERYKDRDW